MDESFSCLIFYLNVRLNANPLNSSHYKVNDILRWSENQQFQKAEVEVWLKQEDVDNYECHEVAGVVFHEFFEFEKVFSWDEKRKN